MKQPERARREESLTQARRLTEASDLLEAFAEDGDVPPDYWPRLTLELARLAAATEQVLTALEAAWRAAPRPPSPSAKGKGRPLVWGPRRKGAAAAGAAALNGRGQNK
jgi:hypothetical protein